MIKINKNYGLVDAFIFPGVSNEYALYRIKDMTTSLEPPALEEFEFAGHLQTSLIFPCGIVLMKLQNSYTYELFN